MKIFTTLTILLLIAGSAIATETVQWLPPTPNDLRATQLPQQAPEAGPSRHIESTPIQFAWAASDIGESAAAPAFQVESRQYWVDTTGQALSHGVKLPVSAPAAVIRVSALEQGTGLEFDAANLELSVNGRQIAVVEGQASAATAQTVTGRQLREQGMNVPDGSLAVRLPEQSDSGVVQMRLSGAPADEALVIHVYEPQSPWVARLSAPRLNFLSGEELSFDVELTNGQRSIGAAAVQAVLVSPDAGQAWSLDALDAGRKLAGSAPESQLPADRGLYEAHVYVNGRDDGTMIRRDLKLAVNIAPPLGRLTEQAEVVMGGSLGLDVGVEVLVTGRYQLNAEILGTNALGQKEVLAYTQSAAVLDAGQGSIVLEVPLEIVDGSGLKAPFEVRNLELLDQGRMFQLEHRAHALIIDSVPDHQPGTTIER